MRSTLFSLATLASVAVALPPSHDVNTRSVGKRQVHYEVEVTQAAINPDGVQDRLMYLINGKYPGEQLDLEEGDEVEIVLKNSISEGMSLHFHGIDQKATPWSDGVAGVSQLTTPPGGTFTYRWTANERGFYFAHSHHKQLQDDGLYFPIHVKSKTQQGPFEKIANLAAVGDVDVAVEAMKIAELKPHTILLQDYRRRTSAEVTEVWQESVIEPLCVDAILINGKGASVCPPAEDLKPFSDAKGLGDVTAKGCLKLDSDLINPPPMAPYSHPDKMPAEMWRDCDASGLNSELAKITLTDEEVQAGWAAFQVVNAGGLWELNMSIDEHPMYIYAVEGTYIQVGKPIDIIPLPSGHRYEFFIKLDENAEAGKAFTIRVGANVAPQLLSGYSVLQYGSGDVELVSPGEGYPPIPDSKPSMNYAGLNMTEDVYTFNPSTDGAPFVPTPPPASSDKTLILDMTRPTALIWAGNDTGLQTSLYEDRDPLIWDTVWPDVKQAVENGTGPLAGTPLIDADSISFTEKGTVLDVIIRANDEQPPHPIHKHLNKFWVIGQGSEPFTWSSVEEAAAARPELFNFENPPYRDGFNTPFSAPGSQSWLAIRYVVEIAGPDVLHCHLSQHMTGGMIYVIMGGMDEVDVPAEYGPSS